jgi:hypothetical protein
LPVDPVVDGAVDIDADALRGEQFHLRGEQPGAGPVDDEAVGVLADQEGLQSRVDELGQGPAG